VDSETIDRLFHAASLKMRVLCAERSYSLNAQLRRIDHQLESTEVETFEMCVQGGNFEKLSREGTVVWFKNGPKDASFAVSGAGEPRPAFVSENPLLESGIMRVREKGEWL
jgi:hypothetical protein